jgi:transposase
MGTRFVSVDHDTPLLLPPNLRDWVPDDHLIHFVLDSVAALDLSQVKVNQRGTGSQQYPPVMMLALLIYSYATGNFSSRRIEQSSYDSVPVRVLTADTHPDHDTLCTFRRENQALLAESFVKVLQLAQELKVLQVGQITVAVDGTRVLANASRHSAVSYERAGQMIEQLEMEVKQLLTKAEQADSAPLQEGLTIPGEIARRQDRKAALEKARAEIEARAHARYAAQLAEHQKKLANWTSKKGKRGRRPKAPVDKPKGTDQYNFTDPESRIMKVGNHEHFEQSYNAQAAVEVKSYLIVGQRVSPSPNDKQELVPTLAAIPTPVGATEAVLIDSGFYSEKAVRAVEQNAAGQPNGTTVYAGIECKSHHWNVTDLEQKAEPLPPPADASAIEIMKYRLATKVGKQKYKLRQQTVEPVFGIIKSILGFDRFLLRGLAKVKLEWTLVCLAFNLKRLHRLGGFKLAMAA